MVIWNQRSGKADIARDWIRSLPPTWVLAWARSKTFLGMTQFLWGAGGGPVRNRLGKCCNTICLTAPWFGELKGAFPLLHCCFFSVWDCSASLTVQLISVACGEFGVGLQLKLLNCVQNLALQPCGFSLAASLACRGAGDCLVHALHAAPS